MLDRCLDIIGLTRDAVEATNNKAQKLDKERVQAHRTVH